MQAGIDRYLNDSAEDATLVPTTQRAVVAPLRVADNDCARYAPQTSSPDDKGVDACFPVSNRH